MTLVGSTGVLLFLVGCRVLKLKNKRCSGECVDRWLAGAREKTLVREAGLDRAENSGSGGDFREEASKGSAQIEVWQDFFHASEVVRGRLSRFEELCLSVALLFLPFRVSARGLAGQDSGYQLVTGNADLGSLH
ncbi:hypothetical protein Taro_010726 [Colocasia esculenta]|uniref:Uncharacterized protein n=1 Tax=Colocasia esculenta TaxID=4460 RepID=A0A843TZQ5_COLES|nr:hypothetical protein [Colocasia esculenta]